MKQKALSEQLLKCSVCKDEWFVPASLLECHKIRLGGQPSIHLTDDQITLIITDVCGDCWDKSEAMPEVS